MGRLYFFFLAFFFGFRRASYRDCATTAVVVWSRSAISVLVKPARLKWTTLSRCGEAFICWSNSRARRFSARSPAANLVCPLCAQVGRDRPHRSRGGVEDLCDGLIVHACELEEPRPIR